MINELYEKIINDAIDVYSYATNLDTYELLYINETLSNHLNITADDWAGKKCYEVLRCSTRPCIFCSKDYIKLNETYSRYRYKRSQNFHLITKDKIIECELGKILIQTSYDVTNEFPKIKSLRSGMHLNQAIISCAKTLLNDGSVQVNISKLLKIVCDFYAGTCANVYEYNHLTDTIDCNYQYTANHRDDEFVDEYAMKFNPLQMWWDVLEARDVIYIPSIEEHFDTSSHEYEIFAKNGVSSFILSTLKNEGRVTGVVIIDNPVLTNDDFDLFSTATMFIANNLEKNRTICYLESSKDSVFGKIGVNEILLECAQILFEVKDVEATVNGILQKVCEYYDADRLSLAELSETGTYMDNTFEYCKEGVEAFIDKFEGAEIPIPQFLLKDMMNNPTVYLEINDPEFDKNTADYEVLSKFNIPNVIMTSLQKKGEFAGLISVHYPKKNIENQELLRTISGFVLSELAKRDMVKELESLSFTDKLTGVFNRNFYLHTIEQFEKEIPPKLGVIFADINGLKRANDNLGHEYGDALIKWCGEFLKSRNPNSVYRIGGDEFVCFVEGMECADFFDHIQKMRLELHETNLSNMSMGGTWSDGNQTIDQQIIETDKIMYLEKQKYYILKQITQINPEDELEVLRNLLESMI